MVLRLQNNRSKDLLSDCEFLLQSTVLPREHTCAVVDPACGLAWPESMSRSKVRDCASGLPFSSDFVRNAAPRSHETDPCLRAAGGQAGGQAGRASRSAPSCKTLQCRHLNFIFLGACRQWHCHGCCGDARIRGTRTVCRELELRLAPRARGDAWDLALGDVSDVQPSFIVGLREQRRHTVRLSL